MLDPHSVISVVCPGCFVETQVTNKPLFSEPVLAACRGAKIHVTTTARPGEEETVGKSFTAQ